MAYTTINKSKDYFNPKLHSGNGSTQSITGVGFQPDFTWIKDRTGGNDHQIVDAVRGATYAISSNRNDNLTFTDGLTSFDSDGYSLGNNTRYNASGSNYVGWNWKANGAGSANTSGSINSTVSVNTTSGFSIVKWTGTGANATVGHGLGAVPKMIIVKDTDASDNWNVYHVGIGNDSHLHLNLDFAASGSSTYWQDYTPTNNVFYIGSDSAINASGNDFIAYCFAEKTGYSKFGTYKGNGATNNAFIYTGFKPTFFMTKRYSDTARWCMWDSVRDPDNSVEKLMYANESSAEGGTAYLDFTSNGIKILDGNTKWGADNSNYIYMAFGQSLVGSNNVPCTAR